MFDSPIVVALVIDPYAVVLTNCAVLLPPLGDIPMSEIAKDSCIGD
jgi:hypothetical protein